MSGIVGRPVEEEKRIVRGVEGRVKWGAFEREGARGEGWKVPVRRMPFAWRGRKPGWGPEIWWMVETRAWLVWRVRGSVGRGIFGGVLGEERGGILVEGGSRDVNMKMSLTKLMLLVFLHIPFIFDGRAGRVYRCDVPVITIPLA